MSTFFNAMPGITSPRTASHRTIFLQRSETFLAGGKLIDGAKSRDAGNTGDTDVLRPGLIMGKATSGGLYSPSILGVTTVAYADNDTTLTVSAATAAEIVRRVGATGTLKVSGPPTAAGTVSTATCTYSAVDTTTGVITCSDMNDDFIAGSFVGANDGSYLPVTFIPDWDYGVKVTDVNGSSLTVVEFPKLPVSAIVDSSQLINWPSDTSLRAWLVTYLNAAAGGQYVFDHIY